MRLYKTISMIALTALLFTPNHLFGEDVEIRKDIFTGVYKAGQNLPTEREFAEQFGTSRGTLRRAI